MKKNLLMFALLACAIVASAATIPGKLSKKVAARPAKYECMAMSHKTIAKAAAEAQTIDLNLSTDDFGFKYYAENGYWYFGCLDDSQQYTVRLAYVTDEENQYGTFTYSDLDKEYSYIQYWTSDTEYEEIAYAEGTEFTISEDDGYVILTGNLIGSDGNTYVLNGKCQLPQPGVYDIEGNVITIAQYYEEDQDWYVRFKDDNYKVTLDLICPDGKFPGTYTLDNAVTNGCFITNLAEDEDYVFTEMNVTTTMPDDVTDPSVGCEITGTAKDADGNTYNFHMKKDAPLKPKAVKNIEVDVKTAEWPTEYYSGGSYYVVTEKDAPANEWTLTINQLTGEATANIDTTATCRVNTETAERLGMNNGTITQTFNAEALTVTTQAELVMNDTIQYNFTFTSPVEKKGDVSLTFNDLILDDTYAEQGSQQLSASTDDVKLSVNLQDTNVPGSYNDQEAQFGLEIYENGESQYVSGLAIISASTELTEDNSPVLHAKFYASDKNVYTIEANNVVPEVTSTANITRTGAEIGDGTDYGEGFYFSVSGDASAGDTLVWVKVNSDVIEGHYTTEVDKNSHITYVTSSGMEKNVYLTSPDFTVTRDGRTYQLTGTCQAGSTLINLDLTATYQGGDYDNYTDDVDVTFSQDDLSEVTPDTENNTVTVKFVNKSRRDQLVMLFYLESESEDEGGFEAKTTKVAAASDTTVPAGEYDINGYNWEMSVQAGMANGLSLQPSYYAQTNVLGIVKRPLWFLTKGTVTVTEENGTTMYEVNAKNTYGRTIHIVTTSTATGIEEMETASKTTDNAPCYNIVGQRVNDSHKGVTIVNGKKVIK